MTHAKFSPSSSKRWLTCTSSMLLPVKHSEKESEYALRGTTLHDVAESLLTGKESTPSKYIPTEDDMELTVVPYVKYVKNIDADMFFYEERVTIIPERCFGTADCIAYNSKTKTLHVIDLKCGFGVFVKVEDNTQLQIYAIGAMDFLEDKGHDVEKIFIHIIQPGLNNFKMAEVTRVELARLEQKIMTAIAKVDAEDTEFQATEEGCRWCPHKVSCPELSRIANLTAKDEFAGIDLSEKMKLVPILKQFIDATETAVFERLQKEEDVPGFKLVRGRGTRKWKADSIAKNMLYEAGISTCDLYTPGKFLSPAQAEKLIKKNKLTVDLGSLVETKFGAPKVVPITDNKPAINKTEEAKNDFSGCE